MTIETFILPAYWATALINSDCSGLNDDEIEEIEQFETDNTENNCRFCCIGCTEEPYFSPYNDARVLAGDVLEYTFDVSPL